MKHLKNSLRNFMADIQISLVSDVSERYYGCFITMQASLMQSYDWLLGLLTNLMGKLYFTV